METIQSTLNRQIHLEQTFPLRRCINALLKRSLHVSIPRGLQKWRLCWALVQLKGQTSGMPQPALDRIHATLYGLSVSDRDLGVFLRDTAVLHFDTDFN